MNIKNRNLIRYENLDTAYVSLAALVGYLKQQKFAGRVRVELEEYEAEIMFGPGEQIQVRERDHLKNLESEGEAALKRLLVRARDPGGLVSVYEGVTGPGATDQDGRNQHLRGEGEAPVSLEAPKQAEPGIADDEGRILIRLGSELTATVEHAIGMSRGADFSTQFHLARLAIADDYAFLDPYSGKFEYAEGRVRLNCLVTARIYTAGVVELLRRTVDLCAAKDPGGQTRSHVARELSSLKRKRQGDLAKYGLERHFARIAGTRVL